MAKPVVTSRILRRLLSSGVHNRAENLLGRIHPADLGPILADLTPDEIRTVVDLLFRQRRAANMLRELPFERLAEVMAALSDRRLAEVLDHLEIDDLADLVEALPEDRKEPVLGLLPERRRLELQKLELYPPSSAGRVMTTSYVAIDETMTAEEAIESIRAASPGEEEMLYVYVVDGHHRLKGVVPIRRLVASPPLRTCSELMIRDVIQVAPDSDQEEVANLVARYDLLAVPVTEGDGTLLGVITVDDVIDVITEEATEDMYHLAGLSEEDRVFSPPRVSIRKRLPWLILNLVTVTLAASVVAFFEHTLEQMVSLAIFLPVVAGMGGNGGIQTLTVTTRGIALGEIEFSTGLRAVGKEIAVGLSLGAAIGLICAGLAIAWSGNPYLGFVMFISLLVTLTFAGLLGAAVPLALKALHQDPALGSGVIVTAVTDAFGFVAFLGTATLLLDKLI
ncbi:MAG: magnesium transporter [Myxococcota bacterium]|nr:magnesium transporter [Myxococcota bacterium]